MMNCTILRVCVNRRVRARVLDRASDASVRVTLCEKFDNDLHGNWSDNVLSCGSFTGFKTLEASYNPNSQGDLTRFVTMIVELPDSDAQTGTSGLLGYRVCRGSC